MKLLFTALALVAQTAGAVATLDNPCDVQKPPGVSFPYRDLMPATVPPVGGAAPASATQYGCVPKPYGSGTALTVRVNASGAVAWWYCEAGGKWSPNWAAATTAQIVSFDLLADVYTVATSSNPIAALNFIAKKNLNLPLSDPSLTPVWCPFQAEMINKTPPPTPAARFVVALNGLAPTRPTFNVVNGVRSYASKSAIAVGSTCDCTMKVVEGSNTFCNVAATLVAVCVKAP